MTVEDAIEIITTCDESDFQEALKLLEAQDDTESQLLETYK